MNVATKVGKQFFQILDESYPPGHPLHKAFNRHTVKLSYSTMPNMLKKISALNSKVTASAMAETEDVTLASDDEEQPVASATPCNNCDGECGGLLVEPTPAATQNQTEAAVSQFHCNCTAKIGPCPLDGDCRKEKSCLYSCKVTRLDTGESETYTGLAGNTFKARFYGHNRNINTRN